MRSDRAHEHICLNMHRWMSINSASALQEDKAIQQKLSTLESEANKQDRALMDLAAQVGYLKSKQLQAQVTLTTCRG